jgi:hypothetical protein
MKPLETMTMNGTTEREAATRQQVPHERVVRFLRAQLKWLWVRIPFFALVVLMLHVVSPGITLSFWQVLGATLLVLLARDYLNWVESKYGS